MFTACSFMAKSVSLLACMVRMGPGWMTQVVSESPQKSSESGQHILPDKHHSMPDLPKQFYSNGQVEPNPLQALGVLLLAFNNPSAGCPINRCCKDLSKRYLAAQFAPGSRSFASLTVGMNAKQAAIDQYIFAPPVDKGCAQVSVERHPELALPRMCIIAKEPPFTDEAIDSFLEFLQVVFDESSEPFSVLWDLRGRALPSMKQFKRVIAWLNEKGRAHMWDSRVQGNVGIICNPIVRATVRVMISIANPPQPSKVCSNEEQALLFAREHFQKACDCMD
mmetsp:Transcript_14082/g.24771  ORF Transcript_14082/g.24771 Transcript_14082/m.24771 type:complete len:279 (-) Transcript_14082:50-886(-)